VTEYVRQEKSPALSGAADNIGICFNNHPWYKRVHILADRSDPLLERKEQKTSADGNFVTSYCRGELGR